MNENELILCDLLNCKFIDLHLNNLSPDSLSKEKRPLFLTIKEKRAKGEPLQYILGKCEFLCLEFKVRPGVFIPRPETEILVEKTIEIVRCQMPDARCQILDIGTGSGNIAVSLAKNIQNSKITTVDISQEAIDLAKENAKLHGVMDKIEFIKADIFSATAYELRPMSYDLIISNPPYIKSADIERLQIEVQQEPRVALDGGTDGLDFYRNIIKLSSVFLKPGGILLFEIGFGQAQDISKIVKAFGGFEVVKIIKDYNRIERVVILSLREIK